MKHSADDGTHLFYTVYTASKYDIDDQWRVVKSRKNRDE